MRWRLRILFLSLMAIGVCWIYLLNYVRLGKTPDQYSLGVHTVNWGGALLIGLLLDAGAGYYLRPFLRAWERLQAGDRLPPGAAEAAVRRALRFPEESAMLLLGLSAGMILVHRSVSTGGELTAMLLSSGVRAALLSSMARDMMHALLIGLLLFTFSRRLLRPAVAAFGLREVPDESRFPVGLRQALVVVVTGLFNISLFISTPEQIPTRRLMWIYLPPVLVTTLVAYLVATDVGRDLDGLAGRLRGLAAGIRPDLFRRFAVTDRDEVGELVAALNQLQDRMEQEVRELERDMEAARAIQVGMLPRRWRLPNGWQLTARLYPAREVGGDFYDLIDLGSGRFGLVLGDAAGKGLPAALLMASTVSLIRSHAPLHERPGQVLAAVNRMLCATLPPRTFVTAVYAVVDTVDGTAVVASAGHFPPLIGRREARVMPALPLGVDPDVEYGEQGWPLLSGEPLVLYSDGLLEGAGPEHLPEGEWWAEALREPGCRAEALVDRLLAPLLPRVQEGSLQDDVTLLLLMPPSTLAVDLPSRDGAEVTAADIAVRFARECGPAHRADDVATAVGEAFLNAITHGSVPGAEAPVRLRLKAGPDWLEATVADCGPPFVPPAGPPNLADQMAGTNPIRGWGFHLIRSVADEVHVEPTDSGKQVRMRFGGEAGV